MNQPIGFVVIFDHLFSLKERGGYVAVCSDHPWYGRCISELEAGLLGAYDDDLLITIFSNSYEDINNRQREYIEPIECSGLGEMRNRDLEGRWIIGFSHWQPDEYPIWRLLEETKILLKKCREV